MDFALARDATDGAVEWESVDMSLAVNNTLVNAAGTTKLAVAMDFNFSYPSSRVTAPATVEATVNEVFLGSFESTAVLYSPSSTIEGEEGLVIRVVGHKEMPVDMTDFANGAIMRFTMVRRCNSSPG